MFDYLRNLTKSAEEKQQEALNAYLDDALAPKERRQFEQLLADDSGLRLELEQRRALKAQLSQLPRRRVPRNFTLDPSVYGRPQRQPLFQLYPAMRTAAVLTAFFFILAISADLFLGQNAPSFSGAAQDVAMVEEVEVTRVVAETVVEETAVEGMVEPAAAVMSEELAVEEPAAEEPMAEEEAMSEDMLAAEAPEMESAVAEEESTAGAVADAPPEAANVAEEMAESEAGESADDAERAATAVPTSSPAPTMTAPTAAAATKSTVPRPSVATVAPDRAVTAVPIPQETDILADGAADEDTVVATAVPTSELTRTSITGMRWLQISLGALLILLLLGVFYVRRQTF